MVKIDLEKAYDRIGWDFIDRVLLVVGFEDSLRKLIMYCVSSTKI